MDCIHENYIGHELENCIDTQVSTPILSEVFEYIDSEVSYDLGEYELTLGDGEDIKSHEKCTQYIKEFIFGGHDLDLLKEFRLTKVSFNDYLRVSINHNLVYNGPFGGDELEVIDNKVFTRAGEKECERGIQNTVSLNIDLKPYLDFYNNHNVIRMETIFGDTGNSWLKIKAS